MDWKFTRHRRPTWAHLLYQRDLFQGTDWAICLEIDACNFSITNYSIFLFKCFPCLLDFAVVEMLFLLGFSET